jgi:signal peptidase I
VVGVPGDRIQMIDGVLHINGVAVERESLGDVSFGDEYGGSVEAQLYRETLPGGASYRTLDRGDGELDNTRVFVVPANHYFVMGDDRDNSADSRVPSVVGYVPFDNFVGRVVQVLPLSPAERVAEN